MSHMSKKLVVLFQSEISSTENKYVRLLEEANINAKVIPTLSFNFTNEETLQRCLLNVDEYGGIIFTSTRAVSAVSKALNLCSNLCIKQWRDKMHFSVGKATTSLAKSLLDFDTLGSDSGNSENLSKFIIEKYNKCNKPLIFPCSNIRKDTIFDTLSLSNVSIAEIVCYETVPNAQFETLWNNLVLQEGLPEILIFFSPSGVQYCSKTVTNKYPNELKPKFVAIGPSTEKALLEGNLTPCKVCEKPTPESVLSAVQDLLDL